MDVQAQIRIPATPEAIFAVYAEVSRWHEWDPDTRSAQLDGPFVLGARGRLVPSRGRAVTMQLSALEPNRRFCVSCAIPGFRMHFDHRLTPLPGGETEVLHHARFEGMLAWLIGPLLVRQLRRGLPKTLASLREHVLRAGTAA